MLQTGQSFSGSMWQYYFAKISPTGNVLWAVNGFNTYGAYFLNVMTGVLIGSTGGVATDAGGNIYITSCYSGSVTIGTTALSSVGSFDIFVAKYSPSGVPLWATSIGGAKDEYSTAIAVTPAGNVYVTDAYFFRQ